MAVLVEHVGLVAGRPRQHDRAAFRSVALRGDAVLDRLVHGLDQAAELADIQINPAFLVPVALLRDQHDLALDEAGVAHQRPARLDDQVGHPVAEMAPGGRHQRLHMVFGVRPVLAGAGRKAAADIHHAELHARLVERGEQHGRLAEGHIPLAHVALLRADMEREAVGFEAEPPRLQHEVARHVDLAAEFAPERPVRAFPGHGDAAIDAGAGRGLGQLVQLARAVEREQVHAQPVCGPDISGLLDGVAEREPPGGRAGGEAIPDLVDAGAIEGRADAHEQRDDLGRGVGLDRVIDRRLRQQAGEGEIVLPHDIEVDDEARRRRPGLVQESANARRHRITLPRGS